MDDMANIDCFVNMKTSFSQGEKRLKYKLGHPQLT